MDNLQNYKELFIAKGTACKFSGLAYDGCSFYLTLPSSYEIYEYDKKFLFKKRYKTHRRYSCICYDAQDKCFWAASTDCYSTLFKLNYEFEEMEMLRIVSPKACGCVVHSVSYNCREDKLLVEFTNCIMMCYKKEAQNTIVNKDKSICFTQAFSIAPFYGYTFLKGDKQYLTLVDDKNNSLFLEQIPSSWVVKGITFVNSVLGEKQGMYLYFLVLKNNLSPSIMCTEILLKKVKDNLCEYHYSAECCTKDKIEGNNFCDVIVDCVALAESAITNALDCSEQQCRNDLKCKKQLPSEKSIYYLAKQKNHFHSTLYQKLYKLCSKYGLENLLSYLDK